MPNKYSWIKDEKDHRDHKFSLKPELVEELPSKVDLRETWTEVYNQGQWGSCTANALASAFDFTKIKEGFHAVRPSRFFIYYNERVLEDSIGYDSGAMLRDGMKVLNKLGVCRETTWNYIDKHMFRNPTKRAYDWADLRKVKEYKRLDNTNIQELKACLAEGYTFVFGFSVFESFESDFVTRTGIVPYPPAEEQYLGGHAVVCIGYDDATEKFLCRNSWGAEWGDGGHFYMPYRYLTNTDLADDFWTIRVC